MASTLLNGSEHLYDLLALYTAVNGVLTDAYSAKFAIFDCSASFPGTQKYPAAGYADVTTGPGHLGTGRYGAFDATTTKPWKPAAAMTRARCAWFYKMSATDDEHVVERWFEVVEPTVATRPSSGLALIQDVKDALGTALGTMNDKAIHNRLMYWRDVIERYCQQPFRPIRETKRLRNSGGSALFLPYAFVGIESWTREGYTTVEDLSLVRIYGNEGDDRHNPKMEFGTMAGDIFTATGALDYSPTAGTTESVLGVWGFVEPWSLGAPEAVKEALLQAFGVEIAALAAGSGGSGGVPAGPIKSEKTDMHSITYSDAGTPTSGARSGLIALLGSEAIRDALDLYRAPIGIAAPASPSVY